jgi:TonB family protein
VVRPLIAGLDANAVAAVKRWKFRPGIKNGEAVNVSATIEVNFRLK